MNLYLTKLRLESVYYSFIPVFLFFFSSFHHFFYCFFHIFILFCRYAIAVAFKHVDPGFPYIR